MENNPKQTFVVLPLPNKNGRSVELAKADRKFSCMGVSEAFYEQIEKASDGEKVVVSNVLTVLIDGTTLVGIQSTQHGSLTEYVVLSEGEEPNLHGHFKTVGEAINEFQKLVENWK